MEREALFTLLVILLCGPLIWIAGTVPGRKQHEATGRRLEAACWTSLWLRLLPAVVTLAVLVGWAAREPDPSDELLRPAMSLTLLPVAIVWTRAFLRAAWTLRSDAKMPLAGTVGLLRPRVVVARKVVERLDADALRALRLHEEAHVCHRDPLRIWLAQLATDLQWPSTTAVARLREWLHALELARDEEARLQGADGSDLAAAILTVACLKPGWNERSGAHLTGDGKALEDRIGHLLSVPQATDRSTHERRWTAVGATATLLVAGFLCGFLHGDSVIHHVPGVSRCVEPAAKLRATMTPTIREPEACDSIESIFTPTIRLRH